METLATPTEIPAALVAPSAASTLAETRATSTEASALPAIPSQTLPGTIAAQEEGSATPVEALPIIPVAPPLVEAALAAPVETPAEGPAAPVQVNNASNEAPAASPVASNEASAILAPPAETPITPVEAPTVPAPASTDLCVDEIRPCESVPIPTCDVNSFPPPPPCDAPEPCIEVEVTSVEEITEEKSVCKEPPPELVDATENSHVENESGGDTQDNTQKKDGGSTEYSIHSQAVPTVPTAEQPVKPTTKLAKTCLDGVNPDHLPPTPADSTPASDSPVESPVPDHRSNEDVKQLPSPQLEQQVVPTDL
ncbi:calphotin-like [Varroa jacobsoni]|uniref:calphotin-like n=1 Tax=Varroa jacobsoni TaxID=62625 RepID=UPI000BF4EC70|nr:calphotin-like [Varroa jacobsoni]